MSDITMGKILQSEGRPRIKECPCCGSDAELKVRRYLMEDIRYHYLKYFVKCKKCGLTSADDYDVDRVVAAWNRRTK